jgi:hypothetical protein
MAHPHASASGTRAFRDSAVLRLLLFCWCRRRLWLRGTRPLPTKAEGREVGSRDLLPAHLVASHSGISSHSEFIFYLPARPSHTDSEC